MEKYIIYLEDVDPDSGDISQTVEIANTEFENYAKIITECLKMNDGEPNRTYKYKII